MNVRLYNRGKRSITFQGGVIRPDGEASVKASVAQLLLRLYPHEMIAVSGAVSGAESAAVVEAKKKLAEAKKAAATDAEVVEETTKRKGGRKPKAVAEAE